MPDSADYAFEPWPDNMPLADQVKALGAVLMEHYAHTFDRSEGAMEKAARLLWEARRRAGSDEIAKVKLSEAWTRLYDENERLKDENAKLVGIVCELQEKLRAGDHSDGKVLPATSDGPVAPGADSAT